MDSTLNIGGGAPPPSLMDAADVFAALNDEERLRATGNPSGPHNSGDASEEIEAMPCPDRNLKPSRFRHPALGEPAMIWVYRNPEGAPLVVAARYPARAKDDTPGKAVLPWVYGRRRWIDRTGKERDRTDWHCKAPPSPRPLYGLNRLALRPDAPVLITEGEKAADAAVALFPDFVSITSQGGSNALGKSDWIPLRGRSVTIWPDRDQPGTDYAEKVAEIAARVGADCVRIVDVPADWPERWDLADDLPEGVTPDRLREMMEDARVGASVVLPYGFRMTARGLFFNPEPTEKNPDPTPIWIAAPFKVLGETRSDAGEAWGVLLRWRDRDGRAHQWAIPRRLIHRPGNEIAEELEHAGLSCGPDVRAHDLLKRFIGGVQITRRLRCVTRTGWHPMEAGAVFVLPGGEAFGRGAADVVVQAEDPSADTAYRAAGDLQTWQRDIAALAVGNDRLVLFLSASFAGPLLDVMAEPSGGLHLVGNSRTGKSTVALVAASVWGRPTAEGQLRAWRGTANGLECTAAETTDTLLVLDEMGQADAREVGDVVYMLANESGKQRASRTGAARRRHSWRVLFLSTGEITLAQKMGEAGKRPAAGLAVRLVDLSADVGAGMGAFQVLHGHQNPAAFAEWLRDAARGQHGTAARAFLVRLARDRADYGAGLRETLAALRDTFFLQHVRASAAGQVRSVAGQFALIGAAGELARDYGVLPWPEGEAMRAAGACFAAWLAQRGGAGPAEEVAALAQVRAFLETHGEARFTMLMAPAGGGEAAAPELSRTVNRAGFRRQTEDGWEYWILPETWKAEVCRGLDPTRVADWLTTRGLLVQGRDGKRAGLETIPGEGKRRVYRVAGAIMADSEPGDSTNAAS